MKTLSTIICCFLVVTTSFAQTSQVTDSLSFLIGDWSGSGVLSENGTETPFNRTEQIEWSTSMTTLLVRNTGTNPESGDTTDTSTIIVYYDTDGTGFHAHVFTNDGVQLIADVSFPAPGTIHLQYDIEKGTIQYELTVIGDKWEEHGYFKPGDAVNRYPFMELHLSREP